MSVLTNLSPIKKNDEWSTPQDLFDKYNSLFNFTLDVSASDENNKCKKYFTKEIDGLNQSWKDNRCWMNPPYSEVSKWIKKADEESIHAITVALVFAKTDTRWFHQHVYKKWEVEFIKGRIKFSNSKNPAPYPSMLIFFGKPYVDHKRFNIYKGEQCDTSYF